MVVPPGSGGGLGLELPLLFLFFSLLFLLKKYTTIDSVEERVPVANAELVVVAAMLWCFGE